LSSEPYVFVRTRSHILMVDVYRKKAASIVKIQFEASLLRNCVFEVFPESPLSNILNLVTLEYHARTQESSVRSFTFDMAQAPKIIEKLA